MKDLFSKQEILLINLLRCPAAIKEQISQREAFHNRTFLPFRSEFEPFGDQHWGQTLSMKKVEKYWKDQSETNGFKGSLEDFIKDYRLEIEVWLINTGFDFNGIKKICFDVRW